MTSDRRKERSWRESTFPKCPCGATLGLERLRRNERRCSRCAVVDGDVLSASQHTPGPWVRSVYHSPAGESFDVFGPAGNLICNVAHVSNSRLIAAAPDLLGALLGLLMAYETGVDDDHAAYEQAKDVVDKALEDVR